MWRWVYSLSLKYSETQSNQFGKYSYAFFLFARIHFIAAFFILAFFTPVLILKNIYPEETKLERADLVWAFMAWTHSACPFLKPRWDNSWQKMEGKKITNICPSFSTVSNINSWRVTSALSYVVSLVYPTLVALVFFFQFVPTDQLAASEPQIPSTIETYDVHNHWSPECEALKL